MDATVIQLVESLLDIILGFISQTKASELLDAAAVRRADAIADAAEALKLSSEKAP